MKSQSPQTPVTIGAALVALGSGVFALVNSKNITLVLIFATIFFLGVLAIVLLVIIGTSGRDR